MCDATAVEAAGAFRAMHFPKNGIDCIELSYAPRARNTTNTVDRVQLFYIYQMLKIVYSVRLYRELYKLKNFQSP